MPDKIKCIIHGSFRKHFDLIKNTSRVFSDAGIQVIAPRISQIVGQTNGFIHLASDKSQDPRITELLYLNKLTELGRNGFSYYVNPKGKLGASSSYELGIDQLTNTRTLFMRPLADHPAYIPQNSVWSPRNLADYIHERRCYPPPIVNPEEETIQKMVHKLILPGSIIAVGAIIVDYSKRYRKRQERDVLMVQTHKWGDRFSIVGGKVRRKERLAEALEREIVEETGLVARVEESICTFDELKGGGYFEPDTHRVFTDNVVLVQSRKFELNYEAQRGLWIPPSVALKQLDLEPNARKTLQLYAKKHKRAA